MDLNFLFTIIYPMVNREFRDTFEEIKNRFLRSENALKPIESIENQKIFQHFMKDIPSLTLNGKRNIIPFIKWLRTHGGFELQQAKDIVDKVFPYQDS